MSSEHYEVQDGRGAHVFQGFESELDLLTAVAVWWETVVEESKALESIVFDADADGDGTLGCIVYWSYLTKRAARGLEELIGDFFPFSMS